MSPVANRTGHRSPSDRVYLSIRAAIMNGELSPGEALKPQAMATGYGVSLAVVREALLRLVGEGIVRRFTNRGFKVPALTDNRWQEISQARTLIEPAVLSLAIALGDLDWEARVKAAHHRLAGTAMYANDGDYQPTEAWSESHRLFHRALLEGCGNEVLLETFDRLWTASELARRWSVTGTPDRDIAGEHRELEAAALARDAERASAVLAQHLSMTAAALTGNQTSRNQAAGA